MQLRLLAFALRPITGIRKVHKMSRSSKCTTQILASLRAQMRDPAVVPKPLDAYIVPTADAHQSEYIAECDQRRAYVSGFTGSAGTAIVTINHAALWTDGRYHLQAGQELDSNWTLMKDGIPGTPTQAEWLRDVLPPNGVVGVDPSLYSHAQFRKMVGDLSQNGQSIVGVEANLIDRIWTDRPSRPHEPLLTLSDAETGKSWSAKLDTIGEELTKKKAVCIVVSMLDEVAWLTNMRGADIDCNPVFFSYALVSNEECKSDDPAKRKTKTKLVLFIDDSQISDSVRSHLKLNEADSQVRVVPYSTIKAELDAVIASTSGKIWVPQTSTSHALASRVDEARALLEDGPIGPLKCVKTDAEVNGMRNAHVQDAIACCSFFAWLEKALHEPLAERQRKAANGERGYTSAGKLTELSVSDKLYSLRASRPGFIGLSFETIAGSGPNGAIIHYKPTPETDRELSLDEPFLLDSGGQYRSGTTDVTRTVHFGEPSAYHRRCNTSVLAGHIRLGRAIFPDDLRGHMLDAFAREALWRHGLEYLHGTGHGVGHFLNVHEGPCGISFRVNPSEIGLRANMIVTDEPGYYEPGRFGIRIESVMLVCEHKFGEGDRLGDDAMRKKRFLTFEPLTLVPIQTKLIDTSLLSNEERDWLNSYNERCRNVLAPLLQAESLDDAHAWLVRETEKI